MLLMADLLFYQRQKKTFAVRVDRPQTDTNNICTLFMDICTHLYSSNEINIGKMYRITHTYSAKDI